MKRKKVKMSQVNNPRSWEIPGVHVLDDQQTKSFLINMCFDSVNRINKLEKAIVDLVELIEHGRTRKKNKTKAKR